MNNLQKQTPMPLLRQDSSNTILCTKGNISCITGSAKSRKTFFDCEYYRLTGCSRFGRNQRGG